MGQVLLLMVHLLLAAIWRQVQSEYHFMGMVMQNA